MRLAIALGLFAAVAAAQPPADPAETAKLRQRLAEQKAEADIRQTLENADKLARSLRTALAIKTLKTAKQNLQFTLGLSNAARTRLTALLDGKLAAVEGRPLGGSTPNPGILLDPKGPTVKAAKKEAWEKYFAELKDVRDGIKKVDYYQSKGLNDAANKEIARLAKTYPANPSVFALAQRDTIQNRLANAQAHYAAMNERWVANQMSINRSSLPAIRDVEFPADWKEKSKRRLEATQIKLTEKEKKIVEALDKPLTINFNERPLEEALQDLSTQFDVPFYIEKKSLEDLGLDLKKGVSIQGKGLSGRTVLRLDPRHAGADLRGEERDHPGGHGGAGAIAPHDSRLLHRRPASSRVVQRTQWGPVINGLQTAENAKFLTDMITKSIEPLMWKENGGPGTVTFHYPSKSIIVRASTEVHFAALGRGFGAGR